MKDPTNDGKGFGGLSGLSGRRNPPAPNSSQTELQQPAADVPIASVEVVAPQAQSLTVAPKWHGIVILGVLGLVGIALIAAAIQKPTSYQEPIALPTQQLPPWRRKRLLMRILQTAMPRQLMLHRQQPIPLLLQPMLQQRLPMLRPSLKPKKLRAAENKQTLGVGVDQVLYGPQIRYCVHEKIRLDAAERVVDSYDGDSVDRFNAMVNDYNSRCGSFRYRAGTLEPIEREKQNQYVASFEAQGRSRVSATERSAEPITRRSEGLVQEQGYESAVDSGRTLSDPEYGKNLGTCLSGSYPMLCKHGLLTRDDAERVERAELAKNFELCISGRYPMLCKHDLLNSDQRVSVQQAELPEKL